MSHFTSMEVDFKHNCEADLVKALESVFGAGTVEIHEEGTGLYGFQGDLRSTKSKTSSDYAPPCHVVVRRNNVGGASNDVGFRRNEAGTYDAYISDYDRGMNFGPAKLNKVKQEYTLSVTEKKLKQQGYTTKRVKKENGVVQIAGSRFTH